MCVFHDQSKTYMYVYRGRDTHGIYDICQHNIPPIQGLGTTLQAHNCISACSVGGVILEHANDIIRTLLCTSNHVYTQAC